MRAFIIGVVVSLARLAGAQPADCFNAARSGTLLMEQDAMRLCQGSRSQTPLACYEKAKDATLLTDDQAISLCRCAASGEPVACYQRARSESLIDENTGIQLCSPTYLYSLGADCRRGYILPYGAPLP